jgi:hypothetical protein
MLHIHPTRTAVDDEIGPMGRQMKAVDDEIGPMGMEMWSGGSINEVSEY